MTEQELKEQVIELIKRACSNYEDAHHKNLFVKVHADEINSLYEKAGYFKEEAELVGRLLERGWIPPEEAKSYVKLTDDQRFPSFVTPSDISEMELVNAVRQSLWDAGFRKVKL